MKPLLATLLFSLLSLTTPAMAQTPPASVVITIVVDAKTYTVTLTAGARQALASANVQPLDSGISTPPFADIGAMIVDRLMNGFIVQLVKQFPPVMVSAAQASAQAAAAAVATAAATAAATIVTTP